MVYNLSAITASGIVPLIRTTNTYIMQGWFGNLILIAIFAIIFISYMSKTDDIKLSLNLSLLIIAVLGTLMRMLTLVSDQTVLIIWVITAVSMALGYLFDK